MSKAKVAVLMGGRTPEHEISLITGREVVNNLNKDKYKVFPIVISRTGDKWKLVPPNKLLKLPNPLTIKGISKEFIPARIKQIQNVKQLFKKFDVVFIAMHGPYGEDGTIQGMLEIMGVPYTGSGVLASALGMDKLMFRKIMEKESIPVPRYSVVRKDDLQKPLHSIANNPPYFIKPHNQGSSVGISIVRIKKQLAKALKLAFKYSDVALVDEYIEGKEVTCGILGNEKPKVLPLVEIIPKKGKFFDYNSKYMKNGAEEIIPAKISTKLTREIQKMAINVHKILGCRGFSRVDFILKVNKPVVLEINTIPGLTPMSLFPKAAKAAG
ncbi:MAG: D-alanine--D-alanine ligase, partial [Patescibacteria group bacterium]